MFDPVDPNTVYVSFFARGIWRSKNSGIRGSRFSRAHRARHGNRRAFRFDVVQLGGETRMYAGDRRRGIVAHFRRNDAVRTPPPLQCSRAGSFSPTRERTHPATRASEYCDGSQCSYDNYVYVPPGAGPDVVYLLENRRVETLRHGTLQRRAVLLSTNAGAHFTDMTEDASHDVFPVQLHPDHHALVTNPTNWRQFFDFGDGGVARSNGCSSTSRPTAQR